MKQTTSAGVPTNPEKHRAGSMPFTPPGMATPRSLMSQGKEACASTRLRRRGALLALLIILPLAWRICVTGLDRPSLGHRDERVHVQAVQEMYQSGQWWLPTVNGNPYFHKPPFKMWLSFLPVAALGESTKSYRLIDGVAGLATVLLTFVLGFRMYRSATAGAVAAVALLGCNSYIFNHGVRTAVQDSMLICLSTLALGLSFAIIRRIERSKEVTNALPPGTVPRALIAGAAIGCGILTKSAAGLMPLIVLGVYAFLFGLVRPLLGWARPAALALGVPAVLIPAAYFVPHFLLTPRAYEVMFEQEVVDRATNGFHNQDHVLFYLERLGPDSAAVPPVLLAIALLFAALQAVRVKDPRARYLLVWTAVPIAFFSAAPSRLTWYIAPTFPAMAVLIGGLAAAAVAQLRARSDRLNGPIPSRPRAMLAAAVLLLCVVSLSVHLDRVLHGLADPEPPISLDEIVMDGLAESSQFVDYAFPPPSLREKTYYGMMRPQLTVTKELSDLQPILAKNGSLRVLTTPDRVAEVAALRTPTGYRMLEPYTDRSQWAVVLIWSSNPRRDGIYEPFKRLIDFGDAGFSELYGWGDKVRSPARPTMQYLRAPRAAMLVGGDNMKRRFGTDCVLNYGGYLTEKSTFRVFLNQNEVFSTAIQAGDFRSAEFTISPNVWENGENVLSFIIDNPNAEDLLRNPRSFVALNWLSLKVKIPERENAGTAQ